MAMSPRIAFSMLHSPPSIVRLSLPSAMGVPAPVGVKKAGMPAPPARMRSASVPCGTNSTSSEPSRNWRSKVSFSPTYDDTIFFTCRVARSRPRPKSSTPALLETMVRFLAFDSTRAVIRFSGIPHRPKPPARRVIPSLRPAFLSAALALETTLFNELSLRPGGRLGSHGARMRRAPVADVLHGIRRGRAGTEQPAHAELAECVHVLRRNDAAPGHEHVARALLLQEPDHLGEDRHVRAGEKAHGDHVHVLLDGGFHHLLWRLVESRVDHLEARVTKRRRHDLGAAVVAVQSRFGHQHSDLSLQARSLLELGRFVVLAEHHRHGFAHLALGRVGAGAVDEVRHQVLRLIARRLGKRRKPSAHEIVVTRLAQLLDRSHLVLLHPRIDVEDGDLDLFVALDVVVDADDDALLLLELLLVAVARAVNLTLEVALLDALDHAAAGVDLAEVVLGLALEPVGERLDVVRAAQRIGHVGDARLVGQALLR